MTTQYTPILKLALPVQGELSGTWGDVVNDNITSMIEQAIAGRSVVDTWAANSHVLTTANGTAAESRAAMLSLTDTGTALTGAGSVVCPALSKTYIVKNGTAQVITVKTASGSGIAVPVGKTMLVYCDGTNVLEGVDHVVTLSAGTLTITGLTTFASLKGADATTVTGILDEDNMASDSATKLVTQQSVKAYVDAQVGTTDTLAEILAIGNTTGSNDIDVDAAQKVQFRDASIYINSSIDGQLDIVADTEIQIATATVDLNGNLDVSGTALVTGTLDVVGAATFTTEITANGGIALGDNDKATFGAGDDLQIYHDGSNSIIKDGGAGDLQIRAANFKLNNAEYTTTMLEAYVGGAVSLWYDNSSKLATTTTGIDVTGTATMDGLTVSGSQNSKVAYFDDSSEGGYRQLQFTSSNNGQYWDINSQGTSGGLGGVLSLSTRSIERFRIASDGSLSTPTLGISNVRFGVNAGNSIVSGGNYNTVVGDEAGTAITTASWNLAVGYNSLALSTTGAQNVALGAYSLDANTTASFNTAVGVHSLGANTTGGSNVAVGKGALESNTTASNNTAVGYSSLGANTTGANNVAVGRETLLSNTTGALNTAVGSTALDANTTGGSNTAIGQAALGANTTASNNTAVGYSSLGANTDGHSNVALGASALLANTTGDQNTAAGFESLKTATTAGNNTAFGYKALRLNTSGNSNTAVGVVALTANTTAVDNTAVGYGALTANTTGDRNTAVGRNSLASNVDGDRSVAVGYDALSTQDPASNVDMYNVGVGYGAGAAVTTGVQNTLIGGLAGDALTTGVGNVVIGAYADTTAADSNYANVVGYNVTGAGGYTTLGQAGSDIRAAHGTATWATVSDERYKKDIEDCTTGLSFINALQPRTWNYKTLGELPETFNAYEADSTEVFKNTQTNHGFIAQEVKSAIDAESGLKDGFRLWDDREDGSQEVAEAALIPILVKAIQELTARLETLEG